MKTFTLWSWRSKRKAATSSTRSMTLNTASWPGSSILRETRSSCGNHLPGNETHPRPPRQSAANPSLQPRGACQKAGSEGNSAGSARLANFRAVVPVGYSPSLPGSGLPSGACRHLPSRWRVSSLPHWGRGTDTEAPPGALISFVGVALIATRLRSRRNRQLTFLGLAGKIVSTALFLARFAPYSALVIKRFELEVSSGQTPPCWLSFSTFISAGGLTRKIAAGISTRHPQT